MLKLNHINLNVADVPFFSDLFEHCLNFKVIERRGNGKFVALEDDGGFSLILMHGKDAAHASYPPMFHVGLLVADEATVLSTHQRIIDKGHNPPAPGILLRGGDRTFGFYYAVPGGVVVEVSTPATS